MALPPLEQLLSPEQLDHINNTLARSTTEAVKLIAEAVELGNELEMEDRIKIAQDLLDRVGYSKKKQLKVKQEIDMALPDSVVLTALQGLSQMLGVESTLRDVTVSHEVPTHEQRHVSTHEVLDHEQKQEKPSQKPLSDGRERPSDERKPPKGGQVRKKAKKSRDEDSDEIGIDPDVMKRILNR